MKSWIKSPVKIKHSVNFISGTIKSIKKSALFRLFAATGIIILILSINSCGLLKTQTSSAAHPEETFGDKNNARDINGDVDETSEETTSAVMTNDPDSSQTGTGGTSQQSLNDETASGTEKDKSSLLFYTIETKKISIHDSEKLTDINAEYPYLSSSADQELADYVNRLIYHEIIGWWILEFEEAAEEAAGFLPEGEKRPMGTDIGYAIEYSDNLAISIVFTSFSYLGGAHGNVVTATCNYDFTDNKEILLSDLFSWESNYTVFLSDYCRNAIKNHFTEADIDPGSFEDMILNGTDPEEPDNFRKFNISEDDLVIRFDQYDVAPYAMGPVAVEIPYNKMSGILYPGGIIEKIIDSSQDKPG